MVKRLLTPPGLFAVYTYFVVLAIFNSAAAQQSSEAVLLSNQVQQLLIDTNQTVDIKTVEHLSTKIMANRQSYSNDVIAKVYLLLTRVAFNLGDIAKVTEYANNGLAVNGLDKRINLALQLKLAEVFIAQHNVHQLSSLTELTVQESQLSTSLKYQLLALSYRSVAYAMQGQHHKALADLKQVEQGLSDSELIEHIELLTILARAYFYLQDFQTSRIMLLRVLKLSIKMRQSHKLARAYLYLGFAYVNLQRFDDAFNAFWESRNQAKKNQAVINIAHANKWLGIVLIKQQQFESAFSPLSLAIESYKSLNIRMDLAESYIALAKAKLESNDSIAGFNILNKVIKLLGSEQVSTDFTGFYRMVAEMYFVQKRFQLAYEWQEKHSRILLKKVNYKGRADTISHGLSELFLETDKHNPRIETTKSLTLAPENYWELSKSLTTQLRRQKTITLFLAVFLVVMFIITIGLLYKSKQKKITPASDRVQATVDSLATPKATEHHYQITFKKAKVFQYPVHLGYLAIENWQELLFHFDKKNIREVEKELATIIKSHLFEFDYAGQLNEGSYLSLFEHQSTEEVEGKLDKLKQTINSHSFAHLGDFSLVVKYSLNTPDCNDTDAFVFLASVIKDIEQQ